MRARRALLYVPGDDRRKIEKALAFGVDSICLDLEDGVAPARKEAARRTVAAALRELDFGRSERLARINAVGTGLEQDDLEAVLAARPDGVVLPKVESAEQLQWASARIEAAELSAGWPVNAIRLLAGVETPKAILNLKEIASQPRLEALIFGGEDFAASLGATRTPAALELLFARSAVVTACAACGLQAIDIVTVDYRDLERVRTEARFGAGLGFAGKQVIHPDQVGPAQEAFTPNDQAVAAAKRLVEAFETHESQGRGTFGLDGRMVDLPLVRAARGVLERARAGGKG